MLVRRSQPLVIALVLAFVAAACGGGGSSDGGGGSGEGCVDLSGKGETFTIRIVDFAYVPSCFTASASQAISVVNEDPAEHTFTLQGTPIDARIEGDSTFDGSAPGDQVAPGTYDLVCTLHPEMRGEVTVVA